MEPKAPANGEPEIGTEPLVELTAPARRAHPARTLVASLGAIALVAAAIGVVTATGKRGSPPALVLTPGRASSTAQAAAASADGGFASPYRYRLTVTAPDLGSEAPVARLEAPSIDDARAQAMAHTLGIEGAVSRTTGGGRQVAHGAARLTIEPTPGGWDVFYAADAPDPSPVSVPGSPGADGSGTTGSGSVGPGVTTSGTGASGSAPSRPIAPPVPEPADPPIGASPTTLPTPPANLPGAPEAERIARNLLERLGVLDGSWSATVEATNAADSVACAPEPCVLPKVLATTRTVVLHPVFDSIAIDGISWQVALGDKGRVVSVSGTWAKLRTLGRYPLRPVTDVFADLVAGKGTSPGPIPLGAIGTELGAPDHLVQPVDVAIDHVKLGFAVMPAADHGRPVVDIVPTYVFSGTASGGGEITQELVAVEATVATPATLPNPPGKPGGTPPLGTPEPQPAPVGTLPADPGPITGTPSP